MLGSAIDDVRYEFVYTIETRIDIRRYCIGACAVGAVMSGVEVHQVPCLIECFGVPESGDERGERLCVPLQASLQLAPSQFLVGPCCHSVGKKYPRRSRPQFAFPHRRVRGPSGKREEPCQRCDLHGKTKTRGLFERLRKLTAMRGGVICSNRHEHNSTIGNRACAGDRALKIRIVSVGGRFRIRDVRTERVAMHHVLGEYLAAVGTLPDEG